MSEAKRRNTLTGRPAIMKTRTRQLDAVFALMRGGAWWTIDGLWHHLRAAKVPASQTGISSRIRDFRKDEYGRHRVERRLCGRGVYEYRLSGTIRRK